MFRLRSGQAPALRFCSSDEICEQAICGRVQPGIFFRDRQAWEDVGFKIDVGRCTCHPGHRLRAEDLLRFHAHFDALCGAAAATD